MYICFSARPVYDKVSILLNDELKKYGFANSSIFVVSNNRQKKYIIRVLGEQKIEVISSFIKRKFNLYTLKTLSEYEQKYCVNNIWSYIYTDRFLVNYSYDDIIKMVSGIFDFYENLFSTNKIDVYYDEPIATLQSYVAYLVGKHFNVKFVSQIEARGFENKMHYYITDPFQKVSGFDENFLNNIYSLEETNSAKEFLERFENEKFEPANMVFVKSKPNLNIKWLILGFISILDKNNHNKYDQTNYKSYNMHFDRFNFYFRYLLAKKYYKLPDTNKKFIYFPLHYQPEASTLICAQKYEKQLFFIDSWAKSLPSDVILYVKEHYALVGHRSIDFYKQLKKYPNVVLIDPWANSINLIQKSLAVTTLTGTAGWEAMLLRKPVFVGGKIFYDNAPGVVKVEDIYLSFEKYMLKWKMPSRDQIITYLVEYMNNIYEGPVYFANHDTLTSANIEKVARELIRYLMKDGWSSKI